MTPDYLWTFIIPGYLFSIAVETPILLVGLSSRHSWGVRLFSGFWLTACTYPVVVLVLPNFFDVQTQRGWYLLVAETFAPAAECALFWLAFGSREERWKWPMAQDMITIVLANLASFLGGELVWQYIPDLHEYLH